MSEGNKNWYGIPDILFIWRGAYNDPLIEYKGRQCSCYIVEDTMWQRFEEDENSDDEYKFSEYMRNHPDDVYELCELALFPEKVW